MVDLFDGHMEAELAGDLEATLASMTSDPHLVNVPSMVGGAGVEGVRAFYADRLIGKFFPPDVQFTNVSRTVGDERLVDELIISFTHTQEIEWMVPGVAPTGRPVSVAFVVIVGVEDGRIAYEHIYLGSSDGAGPAGPARPRRASGRRPGIGGQGARPHHPRPGPVIRRP